MLAIPLFVGIITAFRAVSWLRPRIAFRCGGTAGRRTADARNAICPGEVVVRRYVYLKIVFAGLLSLGLPYGCAHMTAMDAIDRDDPALLAGLLKMNRSSDDVSAHYTVSSLNTDRVPMGWPVLGVITWSFGSRVQQASVWGSHEGIDIAAPRGTPIVATAPGDVVLHDRRGSAMGLQVVIDHGNGIETRYAHCGRATVSPGQRVNRGDTIAVVGASGMATGSHCQYEVRVHGRPVDPQPFLNLKPNTSIPCTLLHYARLKGAASMAAQLTANGGDPTARDGLGLTPLEVASFK